MASIVRLNVDVSIELKERLDAERAKRGQTITTFVTRTLEAALPPTSTTPPARPFTPRPKQGRKK